MADDKHASIAKAAIARIRGNVKVESPDLPRPKTSSGRKLDYGTPGGEASPGGKNPARNRPKTGR